MLVWTEYKRREGIVILHSDDGQTTEVDVKAFDTDPSQFLVGVFAPENAAPEPTDKEKLAALEARLATIEGKVTELEAKEGSPVEVRA